MVAISSFHGVSNEGRIPSNDCAFAVWDRFPVSPGKALVGPHRSTARWWDLDETQRAASLGLTGVTRAIIDCRVHPGGSNVASKDGPAALRTVEQFRHHIVPRHPYCSTGPSGGIRHMFPDRANRLADRDRTR